MLILLIEDHRLLAETIIDFLHIQSLQTDYAASGTHGLQLATQQHYDAIILDINLPGIDGFNLCRQLRHEHNIDTPILMLTARDQLEDKLEGFRHGADDYLVKPFANEELMARIQTMIKRHRGEMVSKHLHIGELKMDLGTQQVWRNQQQLTISPTGFRILRILMRESPNIVSRDSLEQELWGDNTPDTDTLRSHLYNLRKAVDQPFEHAYIQTVKGIGLRLSTT